MLKQYKVAVAVLLVVALLVAFGCAPPPVEEEVVVEEVAVEEEKTAIVGLLGALTGPLRAIAGATYGIEDYLTYINDNGGIEYADPKTGKTEHLKFKWIMGDHAWDSAKCISLYERSKAGGAIWMVPNGSVPALSVYALMARDHIPGTPTGCIGEPCFYGLEEPYLQFEMEPMQALIVAAMAYLVERVWDKPGTPKVAVIAADVGSRRVFDLPETHFYEAHEMVGADLLPIEYVPIAPIDLKIVLNRVLEEGADIIYFDHWGDSAWRVFIHNIVELKLWEKGVTVLTGTTFDPKVSLAEPDVWGMYERMGGKHLCGNCSWGGSQKEYDEWAGKPEFWGVKLSFDLCKKYRGKLPEMVGGGYYSCGVKDGMVIEMVFKATLEKYGYEGLSGETLRDTLFNLGLVDTGGIEPPFIDHPDWLATQPYTMFARLENGHQVCDPEVMPWAEAALMGGKPSFNPINSDPEWQEKWSKYVYTDYMEPIP